MRVLLAALVSGSLSVGLQASRSPGFDEVAVARRLGGVALDEQKLERLAVAKESFAERQIEPLPYILRLDNLDSQIKAIAAPSYASTIRAVGLTAREYVEGLQAVGLVCSGWVEQTVIDVYFRKQAVVCKAWPGLVTRILK